MLIDINKVKPDPNQPRQNFDQDYLDILEYSIKDNGILINLKVEKDGNDYIIVDGECRHKVATKLYNDGIDIPNLPSGQLECDVFEPMSQLERNKMRFQIQEIFSSWSPIDKARGISLIRQELQTENKGEKLNIRDLSKIVGMPANTVSNYLNLLSLNPKLQTKIENKTVKPDWAMAIGTCTKYFTDRKSAEDIQDRLFEMVESQEIRNRRQLGNFGKAIKTQKTKVLKNVLSGRPYSDLQALADAEIEEPVEEQVLRSESKRIQTAIQRIYQVGLDKNLSGSTTDKLEKVVKDIRNLLDGAGYTQ